jgi:hypothetical protein
MNNLQLNQNSKEAMNPKTTYEVGKGERRPFASWWWCATIIGIIPTIILNSLLTKVRPETKRVVHPPINSVLERTWLNADNKVISIAPIFSMNWNPPVVVPKNVVDIVSDIKSKQPDDYIIQDYNVSDHPYLEDVWTDYDHQSNEQVIPLEDSSNVKNLALEQELFQKCTAHVVSHKLHLPTIIQATKELFSLLEDSRRHFKVTTNRKLSRQEINYYFGKHMISKVVAHLNNNPDCQVDGINIYATAQEVIYLFLRSSGRTLPHRHLITEENYEDIEYLYNKAIDPVMWEDNFGQQWELEGYFIEAHMLALGRCLFQFPTAELITDAFTQ